ncbi:MAG: ClbS/DfsB family four-helix bundle protein [Anaerolineales bacterium]|jgi:hypothetical protein
MTEDYHPPTKADLLRAIRIEREQLNDIFEGLTNAQMTAEGVEGCWSIKDILAHIATWERVAYDRIHSALTLVPLQFPLINGDADVDKFNAEIYAENKDQPLEKVMTEYHDSHRNLMDLVETLQEDFLRSPLPFKWAGKLTAQVMISSNTHWHYIEHAESIAKWLEV